MTTRVLPIALVAVLGLSGCGAKENPALLTAGDAETLLARFDEAEEAVADGECNDARRALADAGRQVARLPERTSARLRRQLTEFVDHLEGEVADACEPKEEEKTPTPEPTEEPTVVPEEPGPGGAEVPGGGEG